MLSDFILLASTFAPGAFAAVTQRGSVEHTAYCLSNSEAEQVAKNWRDLIGNYTKELAEAALAPNYTDYSAAALSLNSVCLQAPGPAQNVTDPLFTNRSIFEIAQGSQAPIPSIKLNLWHSCTEVTMRSEMCIQGNCTDPVVGVIAIETSKAPAGNKFPYYISTTYSEFDSEAWIKNLKSSNSCVNPASVQAR